MLGSPREPVIPTQITWGVNFSPTGDLLTDSGTLAFDVVLSEGHEATATVTEHTVEQGVDVVDHVRPNPRTLSLEGFISNVPIKEGADSQFLPYPLELGTPGDSNTGATSFGSFGAGGLGGLLDRTANNLLGLANGYPPIVTINVLQFQGINDYVRNTFDTLTRLLTTGTLLQVFTPKANYSNMVLSSVKLRRDKETGTSGYFTMEFKEIRFVSSKIVAAPLPATLAATPVQPVGKKDVSVDDGSKGSVLAKNTDRGGGHLTSLSSVKIIAGQ